MNMEDLIKQYREELELQNILSNEKDVPNLIKSNKRLNKTYKKIIAKCNKGLNTLTFNKN